MAAIEAALAQLQRTGSQFLAFLRTHSDLPIVHILATPWRWTTSSTFYTAVTTKSTTSPPLLPHNRVINDALFVGSIMTALIVLYRMFVWSHPKSGRVKQILAAPLILVLLLVPLLYTCPIVFFHFAMTVASIATVTRMVDLYYVQPWTGVPSRYFLAGRTAGAAKDETARSKKSDSSSASSTTSTGTMATTSTTTTTGSIIEIGDPFHWDKDRFQGELWSPMRKQTGKTSPPTIGYSWKDLLPSFLVYFTIFDSITYFMSFYTASEMLSSPTLEYGLMVFAVCSFVIFYIRTTVSLTAIVYSASTGSRADPREWTMLDTKLPLFAYSPTDFWINWQTLFRYIWVDLGFNPVQRWCRKHLGPERLGRRGSQLAREILPVYAVFFLSGAMHAYIVYALWREPIWSQVAYFMIQATGVVISKAIERSPVGRAIQRTYNGGSPMKQCVMRGGGILVMMVYHLVTAPFFIYPYQKQGMWLDIKQMSALVRTFRK
ncbi:hypothetical protein KI688_008149 [Linnemannia hyalina]|uniref:Wax synthase domain-containing protein n=1 Tax=Linnemannia hyalina TaxID=64524 RepID=A0A9P7Y0L4_9FUNG|nr:hypothetical protein KI688_008149 [Linnemannia hyalina]